MKHIYNSTSDIMLKSGGRPYAAVLDDHPLYADPFSSFLERTGTFRAVHCFNDHARLLQFLMQQTEKVPLYLFIDIYLKEQTSLPLLNDLKRMYKPLYLIVVSSVTNPILINEIMNYKIDGFLSKFSGTDEIATCLQHIGNKRRYISPVIAAMVEDHISRDAVPFSGREMEILGLLARGLSVDAVAASVQLSRHTIIAHKRSMMSKTKSRTLTELLAFARKIALI